MDFKTDPGDPCREYFVLIGPKGTHVMVHHHGSTFLLQIDGYKSVLFFSPKLKPVESCLREVIERAEDRLPLREIKECVEEKIGELMSEGSLPLEEIKELAFRDIAKDTFIVEIGPGDILYIPNDWFHDVLSLSPSVSISYLREHDDCH